MSKAIATTVVIHACPLAEVARVDDLLAVFNIKSCWSNQQLLVGTQTTEVHFMASTEQVEDLLAALNRIPGIHLDLSQDQLLFMLVPGLGIYRAQTNQAGEIMISEDRIRNALESSAGNHRELNRLMRLLLGQNWDDVLEPFRASKHHGNVALLNRAV